MQAVPSARQPQASSTQHNSVSMTRPGRWTVWHPLHGGMHAGASQLCMAFTRITSALQSRSGALRPCGMPCTVIIPSKQVLQRLLDTIFSTM